MKIGDAQLDVVIEQDLLALPLDAMQVGMRPEDLEPHLGWLAPDYYDPAAKNILLSHHSWVVRTAAGIVLVDPCVGNGKHRPALPFYDQLDTPWLSRLGALGLAPKDVDFVICTHLHVDHCGWNTRLEQGRWIPTFPNARYIFTRQEHDFWAQDLRGGLPPEVAFNAGVFGDSVAPVVEAGQALIVDDPRQFTFAERFSLMETPGHTPGHVAAILDAGDDGVLFCGDVMHWPAQICFPDARSRSSFDDDQAIVSRRRVLDVCADRGWLLATAHFRGPHACRIERRPNGGFA
ncbi:MAG: beta-lactamase, partial [Phenylobacterium sp.]|nr:beta-lactamase [Phenylobacterium sp.]